MAQGVKVGAWWEFPKADVGDLKKEREVLDSYLLRKGLHLNMKAFGWTTRWIACGIEPLDNVCAIPGEFLGILTSPGKIALLIKTRMLYYTTAQVGAVCRALRGATNEQSVEIVQRIQAAYRKNVFQSDSSRQLLENLSPGSADSALQLSLYLRARERAGTVVCLRNQGKRLFNVVMDVCQQVLFEDKAPEVVAGGDSCPMFRPKADREPLRCFSQQVFRNATGGDDPFPLRSEGET